MGDREVILLRGRGMGNLLRLQKIQPGDSTVLHFLIFGLWSLATIYRGLSLVKTILSKKNGIVG